MKKIIKSKKISNIFFFILGAIIFGSVGVVATNYLLEAKDVEYRDNKNLQDAIDELYGMAGNHKGAAMFKLQANGTPTSTANTISINFTKIEPTTPTIVCRAKDSNNNIVGTGTITNNTCNITGLQPETPYTYEIIRTDQNGVTDTLIGTKSTTQIGPTMQTTNLVSTTGTAYQGLLGIVYLDPTNLNASCNASNYPSQNSTNENKSGCLKWYVYDTVTEDGVEKYAMILDHNTTAVIAYNSSNLNSSPATIQPAINALKDTYGWNSSLNPRMISGDEIKTITGNTSWNDGGLNYYFNGNGNSNQATGSNIYAWLFDYTNGCTSRGCNIADNSTYGYWTNSKYSGNTTNVWIVRFCGNINNLPANNSHSQVGGLRPVITVPSSILTITS